MAADDDVAHAERQHGIFDGGGDAAIGLGEGRHDVPGVAADEQVAGLGLHDLFGDDARIGAGDHQRLGALAVGGEMGIERALVREYLLLETEDASDQFVHGWMLLYPGACSGRRGDREVGFSFCCGAA